MNSNDKIIRFAPDIYENNQTMLANYNAQKTEINDYEAIIQRIFLNNLVKYCNVEGIRRFESIFYIQADEINENLEFRKMRVINKFNQLPPFTKIFIKQLLSDLFGEENIAFDVFYNDYTFKVEIETTLDSLLTETLKDLRKIIPANMIIEQILYYPYSHGYLKKYYTHEEMKQFTHGELNNG